MRFPASVQLRRAQLVLILAVLVPTLLMVAVGIVMLAVGRSDATRIAAGVLVLTFCSTAITGYILGSMFVQRGASMVRVQNDFLSSVSHELRTPLTSIRLFIESLRDQRLPPEDQQRVIELLGTEVTRLDRLVGRVLELTRLESGSHAFERHPIQIADVVRDALKAFDAATLSQPTPVTLDLEPNLVVLGDAAMLARAVSNLLINAWKYTGADKRLGLQARRARRWIEITVTDNGIGIEPEERRDIFDEFTRGHEAERRGTPGVGLGLAFVRAIARGHRGSVEVTSRLGEGSTFLLKLPRPRGERAAIEATSS